MLQESILNASLLGQSFIDQMLGCATCFRMYLTLENASKSTSHCVTLRSEI